MQHHLPLPSSDLDGLSHRCSSPSLTVSACLTALITLSLCCGCTRSSFSYLRTRPGGMDPPPPWVPEHPVQTLEEETQTPVTERKLERPQCPPREHLVVKRPGSGSCWDPQGPGSTPRCPWGKPQATRFSPHHQKSTQLLPDRRRHKRRFLAECSRQRQQLGGTDRQQDRQQALNRRPRGSGVWEAEKARPRELNCSYVLGHD